MSPGGWAKDQDYGPDLGISYFFRSCFKLSMLMSLSVGAMSLLSGYFGQCVGIRMGYDFQARFYKHVQTMAFTGYVGYLYGPIQSHWPVAAY